MSDNLHNTSYIDSEGEERCSTCDKWLERDYYTIDDHRESIFSAQRALDEFNRSATRQG
jgi:hypothetical protein